MEFDEGSTIPGESSDESAKRANRPGVTNWPCSRVLVKGAAKEVDVRRLRSVARMHLVISSERSPEERRRRFSESFQSFRVKETAGSSSPKFTVLSLGKKR